MDEDRDYNTGGLLTLEDSPMEESHADGLMSTLVYRSRETHKMMPRELSGLIANAQSANAAAGITGMVIYDRGRFLQWLEGPASSVNALRARIGRDSRHTDIEVLTCLDSNTHERCFDGWNMQLVQRAGQFDIVDLSLPEPPSLLLDCLHKNPEDLVEQLRCYAGNRDLTAAGHIPYAVKIDQGVDRLADLRSLMEEPRDLDGSASSCGCVQHAPRQLLDAGQELARALLSAREGEAHDAIRRICGQTAHSMRAVAQLFEIAARSLGDSWMRDECSEYDIAMAMCNLQTTLRSLAPWAQNRNHRREAACGSALIAPLPGEVHILGATLKSELLASEGWATECDFPDRIADLEDSVSRNWYDVAIIALSRVFRREDSLLRVADAVARTRRASCNPNIRLIVGGRIFGDNPDARAQVGADARCASAGDVSRAIREAMAAVPTSGAVH